MEITKKTDYLKVLCKVIQDFMELEDGQVYIYNQKNIMPKDKKLYICLGYLGENTIANNNYHKIENNVFKEEHLTFNKIQLEIIIYSYDFQAIDRKDELIQALNSDDCQRAMVKYGFHLSRIPINENNTSRVDGTKIVSRYNLIFNMLLASRFKKQTEYYQLNDNTFIINKDN